MRSVVFRDLPVELARRATKYPMPVAQLGCLAVHKDHQGKGLGSLLLIDAFRRVVAAAELIAARALDVKALDEEVREWYLRRGFLPLKDHQDHLYLPLEAIRRVADEADQASFPLHQSRKYGGNLSASLVVRLPDDRYHCRRTDVLPDPSLGALFG